MWQTKFSKNFRRVSEVTSEIVSAAVQRTEKSFPQINWYNFVKK